MSGDTSNNEIGGIMLISQPPKKSKERYLARDAWTGGVPGMRSVRLGIEKVGIYQKAVK